MRISVITLHPTMMKAVWSEGLLSRAIQDGKLTAEALGLRDFAEPPHFHVDDKPYGGGPGMILKCEPIVKALKSIDQGYRIVLSARGKRFTQEKSIELSKHKHLIFICGRYEGIDQRVADFYADEELSVGDAVLMGGEMAAGYMIEAITRHLPGVLGNEASLEDESFKNENEKEYPQYTRPAEFEGHKVDPVLLSGNHEAVKKWRQNHR